jgi:hypothetical protein
VLPRKSLCIRALSLCRRSRGYLEGSERLDMIGARPAGGPKADMIPGITSSGPFPQPARTCGVLASTPGRPRKNHNGGTGRRCWKPHEPEKASRRSMARVPIIEVRGARPCQDVPLLAGISDLSVDPREPGKIARAKTRIKPSAVDGITAEIMRKGSIRNFESVRPSMYNDGR